MLKIMRKKTLKRNLVLAIIIIALASYVLVSFGKAPPRAQGDTITNVGDISLKIKDVKMTMKNLQGRFGQIDKETLNSIASSSIINDAIMKHSANELGINVSNEELRSFIIRFRKGFSNDGSFVENDQWTDWVRFNYQMSVGSFEDYIRENDLKLTHFRNLFQHAAVVTDEDVKQVFIETNQQVDVAYATINSTIFRKDIDLSEKRLKSIFEATPEKFMTEDLRKIQYVFFTNNHFKDQVVISDEDIETYFNERKDKPPYTTKERVRAKHILIKPVDGKKDQALAQITKIGEEIKNGLSFEDAAKKYSEDKANANRGGDLGYATRDRWDPKFAEAAFSLELNQVSEPVESSFGYHLIMVIDKKPGVTKTLDDVKEQITSQLSNRKGRDLTREKAKEFQEKLQVSLDMQALATEYSVEVRESNFFDMNPLAVIDDTIKKNQTVTRKVFDLKNRDDFTDNIDIGRGIVIAKWTDEKEPQPLNWETDNQRLKTQIETTLTEEYIQNIANKLNEKAAKAPEATFIELVSDISFISDKDIKELPAITKSNPPTAIGANELTFEMLYKQEKGSILGPLTGRYSRQYILVFIKNKIEPNFDLLEAAKADIQERLRQEKGMELMANYIFSQREILDPNNEKLTMVQKSLPQ